MFTYTAVFENCIVKERRKVVNSVLEQNSEFYRPLFAILEPFFKFKKNSVVLPSFLLVHMKVFPLGSAVFKNGNNGGYPKFALPPVFTCLHRSFNVV